ncbi:MAG: metalloregulator ArsR/SmtB family transcription factor [Desulfohalobiaceae bacterium]|nr:metalloregulator ArsR/SmtB family transcription factor [Desulfohalobiaceae bacterium]
MTQNLIDMDVLHNAAHLAKSLSDGNRLRILLHISQEKKSVSAIVHELSLSQPLVSHHLKELKHSLLVRTQRQGPFVYYQISDPGVLDLVHALSSMAKDLLFAKTNF